MKKIFLCLLFSIAVTAVEAIIYRHDVSEAEYHQLALQPQFDCVGEVIERLVQPTGSCVLIGDRYVLSAAHVFLHSDNKMDTMYLFRGRMITAATARQRSRAERDSMKEIMINTVVNQQLGDAADFNFRFNRRIYAAKRILTLPEYMDKATKGSCDIALIELVEPVKGVKPAILNSAFDELHSTIINVGFGASGNAAIPEDVGLYDVKLAGENTIDTLTGRPHNGRATLLGFDFDSPTKPEYNIMGSDKPLPLEHMCGGGDSGGGMFRQTQNGWELVGICSGSDTDIDRLLKIGYYGQTATYTRVAVFYDWIKNAMNSK